MSKKISRREFVGKSAKTVAAGVLLSSGAVLAGKSVCYVGPRQVSQINEDLPDGAAAFRLNPQSLTEPLFA